MRQIMPHEIHSTYIRKGMNQSHRSTRIGNLKLFSLRIHIEIARILRTVCLIQRMVGSISGWPSLAIFASSSSFFLSESAVIGNSRMTARTGCDAMASNCHGIDFISILLSFVTSERVHTYLAIESIDIFKLRLGSNKACCICPLSESKLLVRRLEVFTKQNAQN